MPAIRAACVQFSAGPDKRENIERMAPLVSRAAALGADLVLLPEKWNAHVDGPALRAEAELLPDGGETLEALAGWAAEHRILLVGGSLAIETGAGVGNVSVAFDRQGELRASYTKIHLFDVDVGGFAYRESDGTAPGGEPVLVELDGLPVGLTVCYDLRFPELYRALALAGAVVLTVPAAFTLATGLAHWEVLVRARAIENAAFVLAANQHGFPGGGSKPAYGHSLIADPWGTPLAQAPDGDGVIVAELDLDAQRDVRERLPALRHVRADAYALRAPAIP